MHHQYMRGHHEQRGPRGGLHGSLPGNRFSANASRGTLGRRTWTSRDCVLEKAVCPAMTFTWYIGDAKHRLTWAKHSPLEMDERSTVDITLPLLVRRHSWISSTQDDRAYGSPDLWYALVVVMLNDQLCDLEACKDRWPELR